LAGLLKHDDLVVKFFSMAYSMITATLLLFFISVTAQTTTITTAIDKIYSSKYSADGPGCAVLIAKKGEVIYRKAFGKVNLELKADMVPENVFRIASLTKQFTAVAILQLHEKGLLNIADDIKKYIPDFPSTEKITIANLASHTSGIQNIYEAVVPNGITRRSSTPAELIELIKTFPSDFKPGTSYHYSNSGYMLLGYIIEKVSGKSYEQYISDNIFKPLKMHRAYYDHAATVVQGRASGYALSGNAFVNADFIDQSFPYAAGALMMSVDDMYKWNKGLHSYAILKKETLEKAFTPFTLTDGHQITYGFGWGLAPFMESPSLQHSGGTEGFSTFAIYLPSEDVFAVGFSNYMNKDVTVPTLLATAVAAGKLPLTPAVVPERITDRYLGTYQFPDGREVKIYNENATLFLKDAGSSVPWPMHFIDENSFYCEEVFPNTHVFTLDDSGHVNGFLIKFGRGEIRIKRIK
jgi:CubicO group peptidase (beta-lactamase class C family)